MAGGFALPAQVVVHVLGLVAQHEVAAIGEDAALLTAQALHHRGGQRLRVEVVHELAPAGARSHAEHVEQLADKAVFRLVLLRRGRGEPLGQRQGVGVHHDAPLQRGPGGDLVGQVVQNVIEQGLLRHHVLAHGPQRLFLRHAGQLLGPEVGGAHLAGGLPRFRVEHRQRQAHVQRDGLPIGAFLADDLQAHLGGFGRSQHLAQRLAQIAYHQARHHGQGVGLGRTHGPLHLALALYQLLLGGGQRGGGRSADERGQAGQIVEHLHAGQHIAHFPEPLVIRLGERLLHVLAGARVGAVQILVAVIDLGEQ